MIIGHFAAVAIAKLTYFQRQSLAVLTFASIGPDVFDKPAKILFGLPGRGVCHSLFFFGIVSLIASIYWLKIKYEPRLLLAAIILWGSHLLGDFLQWGVLLWPFYGSLDPGPRFHFGEKLAFYYWEIKYPYQLGFEITCILALFYILFLRFLKHKSTGETSSDNFRKLWFRPSEKIKRRSAEQKTI